MNIIRLHTCLFDSCRSDSKEHPSISLDALLLCQFLTLSFQLRLNLQVSCLMETVKSLIPSPLIAARLRTTQIWHCPSREKRFSLLTAPHQTGSNTMIQVTYAYTLYHPLLLLVLTSVNFSSLSDTHFLVGDHRTPPSHNLLGLPCRPL